MEAYLATQGRRCSEDLLILPFKHSSRTVHIIRLVSSAFPFSISKLPLFCCHSLPLVALTSRPLFQGGTCLTLQHLDLWGMGARLSNIRLCFHVCKLHSLTHLLFQTLHKSNHFIFIYCANRPKKIANSKVLKCRKALKQVA
jgi:hypothetical protein